MHKEYANTCNVVARLHISCFRNRFVYALLALCPNYLSMAVDIFKIGIERLKNEQAEAGASGCKYILHFDRYSI